MNPYEFATIVGSAVAVLGILIGWMSRRFDKIDDHVAEAHRRIDSTIASGRAQEAAMNSRIDQTQSIIMRMLEKQGR